MGVVAKKRTENDLCNYKIFSIMFIDELVPLLALFLIFGAVPVVVLVGVIMFLKNRRHRVEEHSKLISQMIEKSEGANIDFKAMAQMLQEPKNQVSTKKSLLNNLKWGCIFSFVGLALLGVALYGHCTTLPGPTAEFLLMGGFVLAIGLGFLVTFFVSKNYLKKKIEKEEKELAEKE